MAEPWKDINDPGAWRKKPKPEEPKKDNKGYDDNPPEPREPLKKEYKFTDVSIIEPAQGFERNKPFDIEGKIEPLDAGKPISASKILLYPIGVYNGEEDQFFPGGIEATLDQKTMEFCGTCKQLFDPEPYAKDANKPADARWKLHVTADGAAAVKPMDSEELTFPKPSAFVALKKGDYDEDGAKKYNKPESGENFKPNEVVKSLQSDLIKTEFLPEGSDDGFFGDQTDQAVNNFQSYAIKTIRMKRNSGKTETTDTTLDQEQPDGVVGKKTRDELDRWLQNNWIEPIPTVRKDDYDDTGVQNGKGKRGGDDHHQGTPVEDAQKELQQVGVYLDFSVDGWCHDHMYEAIKQYHEAAEKGLFIIDGKATDISNKLTGHHKGEYCKKSKKYLKDVVKKNGTVPKESRIIPMRFPLDAKYNDHGYTSGERAFGSARNHGKRAHAGCDLYAPLGEKIYAVADGVITRYRDFYGQTYALEVNHGDFVVRYGEVQPSINKHGYVDDIPPENVRNGLPDELEEGSNIIKGQHIAFIGQLRLEKDKNGKLENYPRTMLHFELYNGDGKGYLTEKTKITYKNVLQKNYQRRGDLLDPTKTLEQAKTE